MSAPFTKAAVAAIRKLYPEALADKTWDNTGLLLESPFNASRRQKNSVLLTIDLTKAVADEAIKRRDSLVVAYHPIIFRGLKSLTLEDTQQQSLLRLAAEGISVYCPHTAFDAAPAGLGSWLADVVCGKASASDGAEGGKLPDHDQTSSKFTLQHPSVARGAGKDQAGPKHHTTSHQRSAIKPSNVTETEGTEGMGRIAQFKKAEPLTLIIDRIKRGVGTDNFLLAIPQGSKVKELQVNGVAVCAGSGGSLFTNLPDEVNLLVTGELSHHEALAQIERGRSVICLMHSNSERGFLRQRLRTQLLEAIKEEWQSARKSGECEQGSELQEAILDEEVRVDVSEVDRDPFGFVTMNS